MFYSLPGAHTPLEIIVSADQDKLNLYTEAQNQGWDGSGAIEIVVRILSGVKIYSSTAAPALDTGALPGGCPPPLLIFEGTAGIHGPGGDGGDGGSSSNGGDGGDGQDAINVQSDIRIKLGPSGKVFGGGGGGGGGAGNSTVPTNNGSGGGGGAGKDAGAGGTNGGTGADGSDGTETAGGSGGGTGQAGGDGGDPGDAGTNGANGTGYTGGSGGAAGKAIELNGNAVTWLDGDNNPTTQPGASQVKGAVS